MCLTTPSQCRKICNLLKTNPHPHFRHAEALDNPGFSRENGETDAGQARASFTLGHLVIYMNAIVKRINEFLRDVGEVIGHTFLRFGQERSAESAASIAFFGLFSLFPMLLVLVAMGSSVLESTQAQEQVLNILMQAFPISENVVEENIHKVLAERGSVGMIAMLGLAWSATGAFTILTRNINRAWPNADRRNFIKTRLMALGMLAGMAIVMVLLLVANAVIGSLTQSTNGIAWVLVSLQYFSHAVMGLLIFTTMVWLYRWVPNTKVAWFEATWGALIASLAAAIATYGFSWFLGSGFANYNLIYGSLGAVAALMFWIYIISSIVLFGAHLSASVAQVRISRKPETRV